MNKEGVRWNTTRVISLWAYGIRVVESLRMFTSRTRNRAPLSKSID